MQNPICLHSSIVQNFQKKKHIKLEVGLGLGRLWEYYEMRLTGGHFTL